MYADPKTWIWSGIIGGIGIAVAVLLDDLAVWLGRPENYMFFATNGIVLLLTLFAGAVVGFVASVFKLANTLNMNPFTLLYIIVGGGCLICALVIWG